MASTSRRSLSERMADVARELQDRHDPHDTMETAVALALDHVPSCDGAGISLVHHAKQGHTIDTPAATSDEVRRADQLQYDTGEGPCLDAIHEHELVHSNRLADDERWRTWGPKVVEVTGFRSIFCFRLFTQADVVGAINLYSHQECAWDSTDRDEGIAIAAHIAVAVSSARQVESVQAGLASRSVIGQAMGILMERFDMDADRAFETLRRLSSTHNVKLKDLAVDIARTRTLPE